jgi:hypothetical protein
MPHLDPLTPYRTDFPALFAAQGAWQGMSSGFGSRAVNLDKAIKR